MTHPTDEMSCGLGKHRGPEWWENNPLVIFAEGRYVAEGRAAFLALVPDRYKHTRPVEKTHDD